MDYFAGTGIESAVQSALSTVQRDRLLANRKLIRSDCRERVSLVSVYPVADRNVTPTNLYSSTFARIYKIYYIINILSFPSGLLSRGSAHTPRSTNLLTLSCLVEGIREPNRSYRVVLVTPGNHSVSRVCPRDTGWVWRPPRTVFTAAPGDVPSPMCSRRRMGFRVLIVGQDSFSRI